jgi:hypothetical protein
MTINIELDKLFDEWQQSDPRYREKFIRDGIVNENLFQKAELKILFLVKDANDPSQGQWNLADYLDKRLSQNFSIRIAEWAYGILNDFPPIDTATPELLHSALRSVAVMNIKKIGGGARAKYEEIAQHAQRDREFIQKQIAITGPTIIVGGIKTTAVWSEFLDDVKFIQSPYDIRIAGWHGIKIIDYYHPSYRVPRAMSYSLLQNIVQSERFRNL